MSNLKVFLRARPMKPGEGQPVWAMANAQQIVSKKDGQQASFTFNKVFAPIAKTAEVFECVGDMISKVDQGYNSTVFAYGQTSSGKTHTMMGDADAAQGILQMAVNALWKRIDEDIALYDVSMSVLEVYNEAIFQLKTTPPARNAQGQAKPPQELKVLVDGVGVAQVVGVVPVRVASAKEALDGVVEALRRRHVAETEMNKRSSRSHTLVQLQVVRKVLGQPDSTSLLSFVDLAGSESMKTAKTFVASKAREGKNINVSLSTLQRCITSLSNKQRHAPFRDSKLTRLLEPSLGGNSFTAVIACVTLAEAHFEQTLSTLRFAQEAARVENHPVENRASRIAAAGYVPSDEEQATLERDILRKQVSMLTEANKRLEERNLSMAAECRSLQGLNDKLKGLNDNLQLDWEQAIAERDAASSARETAEQQLRECVGGRRADAERHRQELAAAQAAVDEARAAAAAAAARVARVEQAARDDAAEKKRAVDQLGEQKRNADKLKADLDEMALRLQRAPQLALDNQRRKEAALQAELAKEKSELAKVKGELEQFRKKTVQHESEIKDRELQIKEGQRMGEARKQELCKVTRFLEDDLASAAHKADKESDKAKQAFVKLGALTSELAKVKLERDELSKSNTALTNMLERARARQPGAALPRPRGPSAARPAPDRHASRSPSPDRGADVRKRKQGEQEPARPPQPAQQALPRRLEQPHLGAGGAAPARPKPFVPHSINSTQGAPGACPPAKRPRVEPAKHRAHPGGPKNAAAASCRHLQP